MNQLINSHDVKINGFQIPSYRNYLANEKKTQKEFLFRAWGGIGDVICAEPTIRYVLDHFKDVNISLETDYPALFSHLKLKDVYGLRKADINKYLVFDTMAAPNNLTWEFVNPALTNCVDFPSLCALSRQIPVKYKEIHCTGIRPEFCAEKILNDKRIVFIHAGKHWETKTFPKIWWDGVINNLIGHGCLPVLIGADVDENRGTVDVTTEGVIDLRNKLTILQSIWLLQRSKVILTNDSSPLHFAASQDPNDLENTGNNFIGFFSTCKFPDFITHWRKGVWSYRMENLATGGVFDVLSSTPNQLKGVNADRVECNILSWLPSERDVAAWCVKKLEESNGN